MKDNSSDSNLVSGFCSDDHALHPGPATCWVEDLPRRYDWILQCSCHPPNSWSLPGALHAPLGCLKMKDEFQTSTICVFPSESRVARCTGEAGFSGSNDHRSETRALVHGPIYPWITALLLAKASPLCTLLREMMPQMQEHKYYYYHTHCIYDILPDNQY